jgi:hypothetical protein
MFTRCERPGRDYMVNDQARADIQRTQAAWSTLNLWRCACEPNSGDARPCCQRAGGSDVAPPRRRCRPPLRYARRIAPTSRSTCRPIAAAARAAPDEGRTCSGLADDTDGALFAPPRRRVGNRRGPSPMVPMPPHTPVDGRSAETRRDVPRRRRLGEGARLRAARKGFWAHDRRNTTCKPLLRRRPGPRAASAAARPFIRPVWPGEGREWDRVRSSGSLRARCPATAAAAHHHGSSSRRSARTARRSLKARCGRQERRGEPYIAAGSGSVQSRLAVPPGNVDRDSAAASIDTDVRETLSAICGRRSTHARCARAARDVRAPKQPRCRAGGFA